MKKKVVVFTFLDPECFWYNPVYAVFVGTILEKIKKKFDLKSVKDITFRYFKSPPSSPDEFAVANKELSKDRMGKWPCTYANHHLTVAASVMSFLWEEKKEKKTVIVVEDYHKFPNEFPNNPGEPFVEKVVKALASGTPGSIYMLSDILK